MANTTNTVLKTTDIETIFVGLTPETKRILSVELRDQLVPVIRGLLTAGPIVPTPDKIFHAFEKCPIEKTTVVIVGQDPYHDGSAMGMSFSAVRGVKIPPSLRNIHAALLIQGLIAGPPKHADLSRWAEQGVLMLNTALTTAPKKAGAHLDLWKGYTTGILRILAARTTPIAFVLWGKHAQDAMSGIPLNPCHAVFEWGHPSPMTTANRRVGDPEAFVKCDSFTKVNEFRSTCGLSPIDWNVDEQAANDDIDREITAAIPTNPVLGSPLVLKPPSTLWIFTDGGAAANGRPGCTATWAWYATDGHSSWVSRGNVETVVINKKTIPASNNRGELTALLSALAWAGGRAARHSHIMIVSDSDYSINAITQWYPKWRSSGAIADKKNIDLISAANTAYNAIKPKTTIRHMNSHQDEPADRDSTEWFMWKGNDIADKLCEQ